MFRIVCFFLSLLVFIGPTSSSFAQTTNPGFPAGVDQSPSSDERTLGSSFGTKDGASNLPVPTSLMPLTPSGPGEFLPFKKRSREEPNELTYQIHILGELHYPGTYRVLASTRLFEALQLAGGLLKNGLSRRIELRRNGKITTVDQLSFESSGRLEENPYLMENDVIFVPLQNKVVQIEGAVKRPGTYEMLKNEKTLEDLLTIGGGFSSGINKNIPIKIIRFDQGIKHIIDIANNQEERKSFQLKTGDVAYMPHFFTSDKTFDYNLGHIPGDQQLFFPTIEERIFVLGAVFKPGPQSYNPYYNGRQYLTLAGGLTKLAKMHRIKIITFDGKTNSNDVLLVDRLKHNLTSVG